MKLRFVKPGPGDEQAAMELRSEFWAAGERRIYGSGGLHRYANYKKWLDELGDESEGRVPQSTYFSYDGEKLIGAVSIRHKLTEQLLRVAGHIGYSVRPSRRGKGYGKRQLKLALDECAQLGISHALVTCDASNAASAKILREFDAMEDRPYNDAGEIIRRFWINTGDPSYTAANAQAWDSWVEGGIEWGVPITSEEFARAKKGDWGVHLTPSKHVPREWFPDMLRTKVLCLAGGGGQQAPIFTALGAACTVLDNSARQLATEKEVAAREGYEIALVKGDMTRTLPFADGSFDLIFHPVSNCYVENVYHVWRECHRVLKRGGILLAGMDNGINFLFNDYDAMKVENRLPYNPLRDQALAARLTPDDGVQFSHTLEEQIGGQLRAGFRLTDIIDDYDRPGAGKLSEYTPLYIATRAVKR